MARPISSRPAGSSATTTLTLENPYPQQRQQQQTLVLRLSHPQPPKKKVTWKEGTVDNEFLQRKSSKKCCIFHKDKSFDEDDSDDDDHNHESKKESHANGGGCCSKDTDVSTSCCDSEAGIRGEQRTPWYTKKIVQEIQELSGLMEDCSMIHVFREANYAANYLAGLAGPRGSTWSIGPMDENLTNLVEQDRNQVIHHRIL